MTGYLGGYLERQIAQRIHAPVASVAELAAIAVDDRADGMIVVNKTDGSRWIFSLASAAVDPSSNLVVAPTAGAGVWLRMPGSLMLVLPITSATADAASLITMPTGALFAPRRAFYRVDVTFTGNGVIGLSSAKTGFTTKGDILGGAAGDAATGLTTAASPFTGTPGAKLSTVALLHAALWKGGDNFRFDILSGALSAGSGAACVVGDLLANPGGLMGRPNGLSGSQLAAVRVVPGVIVADNASLVDANYPIDQALTCRGYQTLWVGVEIAGGSAPTAALEVLVRDDDAPDGKRWKKLLVGAPDGVTLAAAASQKTPALDGTALYEVRVEGRLVFFRIDAVTNSGSTTGITILAMPGKPRSDLNRYT